jgi:hypothetical protein
MKFELGTFPKINIPEKEKDEAWYKQYLLSIISNNLDTGHDLTIATMNECAKFYQGKHQGDEFNFLMEAEDGSTLPAMWINFNKIRIKVNILLGELSAKGFQVNVEAINRDAISRKMQKKNELFVKMRLRPYMQQLEQDHGLPLQDEGFVPESLEELEDYISGTYKEKTEIVMQAALKFLIRRFKWEYVRLHLMRDVLIYGRCVAKTEIVDGFPVYRRIDPRQFIFDTHTTDDFASDAAFKGEARYMPLAEAVERFSLSKEEVRLLTDAASGKGRHEGVFQQLPDVTPILDKLKGRLFKSEKDSMRVLVLSAEWDDIKTYKARETEDKHGTVHFKFVSDTAKARSGEKIISKNIHVVRKATLIGGLVLKDYGLLENQRRSRSNPSKTHKSYHVLIPNWIDQQGVSIVEQLSGLQKLKDITLYNMQLAMTRAGAKGFVYDLAQCPPDWEPETVMRYLKITGIAFIDSKKNGVPAQFNQFQQLDMTLSSSIDQYVNISMMIDREMDAVSGINEARQGFVKNASQAVGVTQAALNQSNLATETMFAFFNGLTENIFQAIGDLIKIAFPANREKFAPIIGEAGIDFLQADQDLDLDLDDYAVFVSATPPEAEDKQVLKEIVMASLEAQALDFVDAMEILTTRDIKQALARYKRTMEKRKKEAAQQAEQAQQQQAQQAEAMQANQLQAQLGMQDKKNEATLGAAEMKRDTELDKILGGLEL